MVPAVYVIYWKHEEDAACPFFYIREKNMDLIMTKWIAMEGACLAAKAKEAELVKIFPKQLVDNAKKLEKLIDTGPESQAAVRFGAADIQPLSEGGIFTALWILAERMGTGLEVEIRKIPVKQEVIEICEYFDLNPYYMLSGGSLLIAAANGLELMSRLAHEEIPATLIGRTTSGNDRILLNGEHVRYLDRPQKEELDKILKEGWKGL